jgi:hypothetical protein
MRIRNIFNPGSGLGKFGSGIQDKHSGSTTLFINVHILRNNYFT